MFLVSSMTEPKEASDKRLYYVVGCSGILPDGKTADPFQKPAKRVIWQQYNRDSDGSFTTDENGNRSGHWVVGEPGAVKSIMDRRLPVNGNITTREVEPYTIPGPDGTTNTVKTYTTVVFPGENVETVFRNAGHPIVEDQTDEVTANAPVEDQPSLVK